MTTLRRSRAGWSSPRPVLENTTEGELHVNEFVCIGRGHGEPFPLPAWRVKGKRDRVSLPPALRKAVADKHSVDIRCAEAVRSLSRMAAADASNARRGTWKEITHTSPVAVSPA